MSAPGDERIASSRRGLRWGKYLAIAALSARQRLEERASLWGRVAFYFIVLLIFARLWNAVLDGSHAEPGASPARYIWYLAVTEWIMLSQPQLHFEIEAEIRAGEVGHRLSVPVSYVAAKLAENAGEVLVRLVVLGASGLVLARLLGAEWPEARALLLAGLAGLLASAVLSLVYAMMGLSALWGYDTTAVYLIWQKLCFVLGGLMLPLSIYPAWLRAIAEYSPFSALLYGPGQLVLGSASTSELALGCGLRLLAWGVLFGLALVGLERRALKLLARDGG